MKVYGIEPHILRNIARDLDIELSNVKQNGRALSLVLRPCGEKDEHGNRPWQRMSNSGRRIHAVCWHGHWQFMYKALGSGATRITSSRFFDADYTPENFEEAAEETGDINIGSEYYPMRARDACFCEED
jgi:hypothetical protein